MDAAEKKYLEDLIDRKSENNKKKFRSAVLIASLPAVFTVGIAIMQMRYDAKLKEIELLTNKINSEVIKSDQLDSSFIDTRTFLKIARSDCKLGKYQGNFKMLNSELLKNVNIIAKNKSSIKRLVAPELRAKVANFNEEILKVENICSKDYPSDDYLRKLQTTISDEFTAKIHEDEEKRTALQQTSLLKAVYRDLISLILKKAN